MGMFKIFAGFNTPEVMIPLYAMMAAALSLIVWLIWSVIQLSRQKPNPKYLFLKLLLASSALLTIVYITVEKIKYL